MWMTEKYQITQADYNRMMEDEKYKSEFIRWRAHFSSYPPAGYGFGKPQILNEGNSYYCTWSHRDDCD